MYAQTTGVIFPPTPNTLPPEETTRMEAVSNETRSVDAPADGAERVSCGELQAERADVNYGPASIIENDNISFGPYHGRL